MNKKLTILQMLMIIIVLNIILWSFLIFVKQDDNQVTINPGQVYIHERVNPYEAYPADTAVVVEVTDKYVVYGLKYTRKYIYNGDTFTVWEQHIPNVLTIDQFNAIYKLAVK